MPPLVTSENFSDGSEKRTDYEELINSNRVPIALFLVGMILLGAGVFIYKTESLGSGDTIEVISAGEPSQVISKEIVIEISGEVIKPGVFKLPEGSRIEDALIASGGFSADADREWAQKYINRAAKLSDGQKLYIPKLDEQLQNASANKSGDIKIDQQVLAAENGGLININNASLSLLDSLPGIGQVYGQKIIEHRPYSSIEELVSKGVLKKSVYEKIKDKVSVY